ncbi:3-ketosteroid-delta-1-dehydrogenase [Williamsia sp. Leaf354]|uniref:3-oxosteroid 1-dehydrogenase n=1 Tax=Williamsia sp. Leaf354 TaxID=1736349 RepID=UPI0006FC1DD3|nr:3-oxosteroid 1-dehydrogenase [Williamsia sp. Leaf354]KQS00438.1 3-ketosteroid-delta-1-dehydrogenase [Williamsia sp. Leaf354]
MTSTDHLEAEYDVVVVGAGGAGMSAAITAASQGLKTVIIEKSAYWGGSTSRSGGGVWIPNNSILERDGVKDDPEAARTYVRSIVGDVVAPERIDAYIDNGPKVLDFLSEHAPLDLEWVKNYSDYYPEAPGGRVGGRSCEPRPFNAKKLGADFANLHPQYTKAPLGVVVKQSDYRWLSTGLRHWRGPLKIMQVGLRMIWGRVTRKHLIGMGAALMSELLLGVRKLGVPLLLNTGLTDLVTENGRVVGVTVDADGTPTTIRARKGVILACGGFEHNEEMRKKYQREPIGTEWTTGAPSNTGDGINAGIKIGAAVSFMEDSWWGPTIMLPRGPWFALAERSLPCSFMVNTRGKRFMNESLPYVEAVHQMFGGEYGQGEGPGENIPAWLVFDQTYRDRYMFASVSGRQPLPGKWFTTGAVLKAGTLESLAEKMDVPADALVATAERFNGFARNGSDEDFGRGVSKYDHYYGDITNKPNPSLGELTKAPYYAVKMFPGDLGTKGGINTDVAGRALREDGSIIEGLYAAGNTSSPVMGHTYAGPGATIGPAMVFGYLAAMDIAASDTVSVGSDRQAG